MKTTIEAKINFPETCQASSKKVRDAYQLIVSNSADLVAKLNQINENSDLAQVSFINLCAMGGSPFGESDSMYMELVFDYDHHGDPDYVTEYIASAKALVDTLNVELADDLQAWGLDQFLWVQQEGTRASLI